MELVLSFRSSIPGKRSVRCVCSKVTFLCGMVSFTAGLTRWVNRPMSSAFLIILIVCISNVVIFFGVSVFLTTIIVVVVFSTIGVISAWEFFPFHLTALVSIVIWLFAMVASWFGLLWVLLCGLLRHNFYLQFIWGFQNIQFQLPFKMRQNLIICAILQIRLVDWFFQVGWHFGIYELFSDLPSCSSECIFC